MKTQKVSKKLSTTNKSTLNTKTLTQAIKEVIKAEEENKDDYATKTVLANHSVNELLGWRDTASKRVDIARARMEKISKEFNDLNKKSHKDIKWIRRLHNELSRKVFGHRGNFDRHPFEKPDPIRERIEHHISEIAKLDVLNRAIER